MQRYFGDALLVFISDVGAHARADGDEVQGLADLAERAAADTEIPSTRKLGAWVRSRGIALINQYLPERRYRELAAELRQD